jgi:tetratricopeptide (TPR) repeat protein/transcriptional regulator with XRE-family HTH domain
MAKATAAAATFAGLLRAHRERALLTQEALAERSGLSVRTIRDLELGRVRRPRSGSIRLLAGALGLESRELEAFVGAAGEDRVASAHPQDEPPGQLPMDVADFTGRDAQLEALDALLSGVGGDVPATAVVLSAIAGAGGVGKTALAVRWAHRVRERFPDGQLFVDLRGYASGPPLHPAQALAQMLAALGVEPDRIPVEAVAASSLLRSLLAGRRVLVLLDNARDAGQVRPLLPGSPECLVIVTSRDQLAGLVATHGARRLTLDVLTTDEAVGLIARILGDRRVAAEPEAAAQLAVVCGCLPLAVRIAAANLSGRSGQSIAGYLAELRAGDRLAHLAVDGDPQAAVRVAFDGSYALLDADAQRLFRLAGLVPGPHFTAEAAAALAQLPVPRARRLLERMVAAHLIEPRAAGRFGLHDLLRLYARECAGQADSAAQRDAAVERLMDWYVRTTDAAADLLYPEKLRLPVPEERGAPVLAFSDRAMAAAWLRAEQANLVAIATTAPADGTRRGVWLLAGALLGWFFHNRHMVDWLAVARVALDAAVAAGDLRAQAISGRNLALAHQSLGEYAVAAEHATAALAVARESGWQEAEGAVLGVLGYVCTEMGQLIQATEHHRQSLALYRRSGSHAGQAVAFGNLGDVHREMGMPQQAADYLEQSLALYREVGSSSGQATALLAIGEAHRDLGMLEVAERDLDEALALTRQIGNRYSEAYELRVLATVQCEAGRHTRAAQLAQQALTLARDTGEPRLQADALNALGCVEQRQQRWRTALDHHRRALVLARRAGARYPETEALLGLAAGHQDQGDLRTAMECARTALAIARDARYRILEGQAHAALAALALSRGDHGRATADAQQALDLHRQAGHRLGEARALVLLGEVRRRAGGSAAALACWRRAVALYTGAGAPAPDHILAAV